MNGDNVGSGGLGHEIGRRLIQHAARNTPPPLAERLQEEWLADLDTRQGQMSRLLFGIGCCWATRIIARDYRALKLSAASAAKGSMTMTARAQADTTFFSRRTSVLIAMIGVHVLVIYALATGVGHQLIKQLPTPLVAEFLKDPPAPTQLPPPPTTVDLERPRVIDLGPPPEVVIDTGPDLSGIQREPQPTVSDPVPSQLPPAPAPMKRVLGGPGKGFPNFADYYPSAARRLGEQGNAAVQVCVDPSGRLTSEPKLMQSSGSARLDEGAIKLATAGSGHYRATTENGTPVSSCFGYLIKFNLL